MKFAYYPGCNISTEAYGYEMSAKEVLGRLGVELVTPEGFACCGITIQYMNSFAFLCMSARNLAIAEKTGLDVVTLCTGCRKSLSETQHALAESPELKERVNKVLAAEGLAYEGKGRVIHVLALLYDEVGLDGIRPLVTRRFDGLKVAPHYGCHALRPGDINPQDDPDNPQKLDDLVRALGPECPPHPKKLECCGAPLLLSDENSSFTMTGEKLGLLCDLGFDGMVTICPSCQKMFDNQKIAGDTVGKKLAIPVMYYTQLLGLAMGIDPDRLGLGINQSDCSKFIAQEGV